jgi:hypothetical protein
MKRINLTILFLATQIFLANGFSQTVITVTDSNLNGWEKQPRPNMTLQFTAGVPAPLLGNGSLEYYNPTGIPIIRVRSTSYHNALLSSLTAFRYSTFIQSRDNNTENIFVVLQVDRNDDGRSDDHFIFEPRFQTGRYVKGKVPDQGPTVLNKWQTWDMLNGIWWFGAPPLLNPEMGGEFVSFADYLSKHPTAKIINEGSAGGTGGIRLGVGAPPGYGSYFGTNFKGNADAFTVGVNGNTTIYDFEPGIAKAGADTILSSGSKSIMLKGTGAGGIGPH